MVARKFPDLASQVSSPEAVVQSHIAGTYVIDTLSVILRDGQQISLSEVMTSLSIYEDIFNPAISGTIEILDYVGGLEKFQFTGGEYLRIKLFKPNAVDVIVDRSDLIIHTITKGEVSANNSVRYGLQFTSESSIRSRKKRVYKSWGGQRRISEIVKDLCSEMDVTVNISNSLPRLDKTFVSPGYTPIQAINFLAKRACASGDYFLFFERVSTGKVFAGMSNLRSLSPKLSDGDGLDIYNIVYFPSITYNEAAGAETTIRAESVEPQTNFNHLNNMAKGFYKSKLTNVNIARRSVETYQFDYQNGINDFYVNNFVNSNSIFGNFSSKERPGERIYTPAINDPMTEKTQWIKYDMHGSLSMSGIRVNVAIDGGTNEIGAGDIVNLSLPSDFAKTIDPNSPEFVENNMYSGKYFVTACKHYLTNEIYTKHLELSRSSVRESLLGGRPAESAISVVTPEQGYLANAVAEVKKTEIPAAQSSIIDALKSELQATQSQFSSLTTAVALDIKYLSNTYVNGYSEYFEQQNQGAYKPPEAPAVQDPVIMEKSEPDGVVTKYAVDSRINNTIRSTILQTGNFGVIGLATQIGR